MHHFRTASHHPAAATHHAPAHTARARPSVLAAGGAVLRENGNDKTAEACGQYGDARVRCSCKFSSCGEEVPEAGSRPGRGTRLEKPSSSELSSSGSTGGQPDHALGGRLQELLRQLLVIESAREDHRADHRRKNRHGLAAGLLALSVVNPKAEHPEVFPDPGFE